MGKSVGVRDGGELHSLFLGMLCAHMENGGEEEEEEEEEEEAARLVMYGMRGGAAWLLLRQVGTWSLGRLFFSNAVVNRLCSHDETFKGLKG